ncbi:MAG: hypothetical protein LBR18_02785 [Tannerella sp.]|jgi:hypothetical protein|nr:hypothetical protein [Tannerella sp.]
MMRFGKINILIITVLLLSGCKRTTVDGDILNGETFKNPPREFAVHTWWHWLSGQITKEGITKDLESMRAQGVSQATILNAGAFYVEGMLKEETPFGSERWYDMFSHALKEAARLDITLGVHNCDGWSASGGPWITPEMSMKKFVFTKTAFKGGQKSAVLPKPLCDIDFYRDVAVIACRTAYPAATAADLQDVTVMLNDTIDGSVLKDGSPESMLPIFQNTSVTFIYGKPVTKSSISILLNFKGAFYFPGHKRVGYTLSASDDGKHYRKTAEFDTEKFYTPQKIDFPSVTAKYFRLEVSRIYNLRPWHQAAFAEVQLLGGDEKPVYSPTVPFYLEKVASGRILDPSIIYQRADSLDKNLILSKLSMINLTDRMKPDGELDWEAPEGDWVVFRFGYTSTGAINGPATVEGTGLECDKLDTAAVNLHFRNFPLKLIETAGDFTGNTFKFLLLDSWEKGFHTWTKAFPDEFLKRRGYEVTDWLPVLCGETMESVEATEGFLYDFRLTLAELMEENYYRHFSDLSHKYGLELHAEAAYGNTGPYPPLDVLRTNSILDMPMFEFWAIPDNDNTVNYRPENQEDWTNFAAFTHNFYKPRVVGAEAYTGYAHYSETPANLKLFGDMAYCAGINQMIFHSYVHQALDSMPGVTLGGHGSVLNRSNPFWNYSRGWLEYQARVQYLLQKGEIAAEILYFIGDQMPQFFANSYIDSLPRNVKAVPCNADVLSKLIVTADGKLKVPDRQEYEILVLPDKPLMTYSTMKQIERLKKDGATIVGMQQEGLISLSDMIREGHCEPSPRHCERSEAIQKIIANAAFPCEDINNIAFIHKKTSDADIYFFVNQLQTNAEKDLTFRVKGRTPEIWDPLTGVIHTPDYYEDNIGILHVPIIFDAAQSLFVVFREGKNILAASPVQKPFTTIITPRKELEINNFSGKIIFQPLNCDAPTDSIEISTFGSFTDFEQPIVKYFSGYATYKIDFEISDADFLQEASTVFLNFGQFSAAGEATLNETPLGNIWMPNSDIPVTGLLEKNNHLEITVATTCRNRIIGDLREYGRLKSVWSHISNVLTATSGLQDSGVSGPVKLKIEN